LRESLGESDSLGLFALNLDPDGTSFWTAGVQSNRVVRVDIASGAVLASFTPALSGQNGGLAIYDEIFGIDSPTLFADGFE
jgi:DNA-binding beta-propeller fold protein YncE